MCECAKQPEQAWARVTQCQALQGHPDLQETAPAATEGAHGNMLRRDGETGSTAQRAHREAQALRIGLNQHTLVLLQAGRINLAH